MILGGRSDYQCVIALCTSKRHASKERNFLRVGALGLQNHLDEKWENIYVAGSVVSMIFDLQINLQVKDHRIVEMSNVRKEWSLEAVVIINVWSLCAQAGDMPPRNEIF